MQYFSLYDLNQKIKSALAAELEPTYWVVAEIGEMRVGQNGHCYLDLVEKNGDYLYAKIRATIWCNTFRGLGGWFESMTGEALRPGLKILAQVSVSFHHLYGLSLNVKDIDAQYTLGERALKRQEVINQLIEDGVFDMNKGLVLSDTPQQMAVISSPTAAGLEDFMKQLQENRLGYGFSVDLFKAKMQGNEAEDSLIKALHQIYNQYEQEDENVYDCVIIIRGGGAQVDLDCFDSYNVAAHVAQFPIPVITGIGHERDETVIDLIAHTRMKTPTAVAEFLVNRLSAFEETLDEQVRSLTKVVGNALSAHDYQIQKVIADLKLSVSAHLLNQRHQLERVTDSLHYASSNKISQCMQRVDQLLELLQQGAKTAIGEEYQRMNVTEKLLQLTDPDSVLKRGYSITYLEGKPIHSLNTLKEGMVLKTKTNRALITSSVNKIINTDNA